MKKILISQRVIENTGYPEWREALDVRWGSLAAELGFCPIPVLSAFPPGQYFDSCQPDGLILSGGNNLSEFEGSDINQRREHFEKSLLTEAIEREIPVLGVCRGMQFLAAYYGSKLVALDGHVAEEHEIAPATQSRFQGFEESRKVNSFHQFGLREISKPLRPLLCATDGSVEAFEHESLPLVGLMWHPERGESVMEVPELSASDRKIFASLFGIGE